MNKQKKDRSIVRRKSLVLPMNDVERELVEKAANAAGVTMASLGRMAISEYVKKRGY